MARFDVMRVATHADERVVRKAAFGLYWLDVCLALESFCLLLLSTGLSCLGLPIGQMCCCSVQASIGTY